MCHAYSELKTINLFLKLKMNKSYSAPKMQAK